MILLMNKSQFLYFTIYVVLNANFGAKIQIIIKPAKKINIFLS